MTNSSHESIACTLSAGRAANQFQEWVDLHREVRRIEELDGGVVMVFDIDLADRVEDLAAREATCCGFLSLTTHQVGDELRLEITSDNADAAPVIGLLAGTAGL